MDQKPPLICLAKQFFPHIQFSASGVHVKEQAIAIVVEKQQEINWQKKWEDSEMKYRFDQAVKALTGDIN